MRSRSFLTQSIKAILDALELALGLAQVVLDLDLKLRKALEARGLTFENLKSMVLHDMGPAQGERQKRNCSLRHLWFSKWLGSLAVNPAGGFVRLAREASHASVSHVSPNLTTNTVANSWFH